jgi:hypothetical protein
MVPGLLRVSAPIGAALSAIAAVYAAMNSGEPGIPGSGRSLKPRRRK